MSMTLCDACGCLLDTDADPECYYHIEGNAVCEACREESDATHPEAMT